MIGVKSGRSPTASANIQSASKPTAPDAVLMGIRESKDSRASKSGGSLTTGSPRGRKPLVVETINAGSEWSSGLVSERTLKLGMEVETVILKIDSRNIGEKFQRFRFSMKRNIRKRVWEKLSS
jgi:hypothetical protein